MSNWDLRFSKTLALLVLSSVLEVFPADYFIQSSLLSHFSSDDTPLHASGGLPLREVA